MKFLFFISIAVMAFMTSACARTFLIGQYGSNYFLGDTSDGMYKMLCASGDLEKVLLASHLSQDKKDALYKYNCSAERSGKKIRQIYASMTVAERDDIKDAFKNNGFAVNVIAMYDDQCATSGPR